MSPVLKGAFRMCACGVCEKVRIASRISEVVQTVSSKHPGGFKEPAIVITAKQRLAMFVEHHNILRWFREMFHIRGESRDLRHQRRLAVLMQVGRSAFLELIRSPVFKLSSPDAAEVHVALAVCVGEHRRINTEAAFYRFGFCFERAFRML